MCGPCTSGGHRRTLIVGALLMGMSLLFLLPAGAGYSDDCQVVINTAWARADYSGTWGDPSGLMLEGKAIVAYGLRGKAAYFKGTQTLSDGTSESADYCHFDSFKTMSDALGPASSSLLQIDLDTCNTTGIICVIAVVISILCSAAGIIFSVLRIYKPNTIWVKVVSVVLPGVGAAAAAYAAVFFEALCVASINDDMPQGIKTLDPYAGFALTCCVALFNLTALITVACARPPYIMPDGRAAVLLHQ